VSRDVADFVGSNARHFERGTINNCIRSMCDGSGGGEGSAGGGGDDGDEDGGGTATNKIGAATDAGNERSWCVNNRGQLPSLEDVQVSQKYIVMQVILLSV
jgi:hypothetical protein